MLALCLHVVGCTTLPPITHSSASAGVVHDDGSVDATIGGVRVTGPEGAVSGAGITIEQASSPDVAAVAPLHSIAGGVEVVLGQGTVVNHPLTLAWSVRAPEEGAIPVVAHGLADGTWEFIDTQWDGMTASVQASSFSPHVLGWFQPSKVTGWFKERAWTFLSAQRTQPPCATKHPSWFSVGGVNDSVQVCTSPREDGLTVTIGSLRDYWLQVDVPKDVEMEVPDQFLAFRMLTADTFGFDVHRTVLLPPGGTMTLTVKRPRQTTSLQVRAAVTANATVVNGLVALMEATGWSPDITKTSESLKLLVECGGELLKEYAEDNTLMDLDKYREVLQCTALGGLSNLMDRAHAQNAVDATYGQYFAQRTLSEQTELLHREAPKFQRAGKICDGVNKVKAARDAVIAAWAPFSDALQNLLLKGDAFDVSLQLKGTDGIESKHAKWKYYTNPRFGFTGIYPPDWPQQEPPANGDGAGWEKRGVGQLIYWGSNNSLNDTPQSIHDSLMDLARSSGSTVTYIVVKGDSTVVSWINQDGTIVYWREWVGPEFGSINGMRWSYPAEQSKVIDPLVAESSQSFKPGNLNEGG